MYLDMSHSHVPTCITDYFPSHYLTIHYYEGGGWVSTVYSIDFILKCFSNLGVYFSYFLEPHTPSNPIAPGHDGRVWVMRESTVSRFLIAISVAKVVLLISISSAGSILQISWWSSSPSSNWGMTLAAAS